MTDEECEKLSKIFDNDNLKELKTFIGKDSPIDRMIASLIIRHYSD